MFYSLLRFRLNSTQKNDFLGFLISKITKLLRLTLRWEQEGVITNNQHWSVGEPAILAFWHSQQIFMPYVYDVNHCPKKNRKPLFALASTHRDGQLAAQTIKNMNISYIGGSSTRGGRRAFVEMIKKIKTGNHVIIAPDGPKGPVEIAKLGTIKLASMTGAKIIPVALNAKWKWSLKSWDSMFIPIPFSKVFLLAGEGYSIKKGLSKEELISETNKLTEILVTLNKRVNFKLGINE